MQMAIKWMSMENTERNIITIPLRVDMGSQKTGKPVQSTGGPHKISRL